MKVLPFRSSLPFATLFANLLSRVERFGSLGKPIAGFYGAVCCLLEGFDWFGFCHFDTHIRRSDDSYVFMCFLRHDTAKLKLILISWQLRVVLVL